MASDDNDDCIVSASVDFVADVASLEIISDSDDEVLPFVTGLASSTSSFVRASINSNWTSAFIRS